MRSFVPFGALWAMPIEIPYSLLVRDGDVAWTCGQVPLDGDSRVVAPDDLVAQSRVVSDHIEEILRRGALSNAAIGKLGLYYVARRNGDKERMIEVFRARFGSRPILAPIAVPHFYYQGLLLEVDVFASAEQGRMVEKSNDAARVQLVDGGALTWASLTVASGRLADGAELLDAALGELDLKPGDRISDHWVAPAGETPAQPSALISDHGAVLVGAPGHDGLAGELTYSRAPDNAVTMTPRDMSDVRVVTRQHGRFLWVGARCLDGGRGLVDQTSRLMDVMGQTLLEHGLGFDAVVKSTSHYVGGGSPDDLHDNMAVRNRYYDKPGPASTGLPVFGLADDNSRIAVDVLAVRG